MKDLFFCIFTSLLLLSQGKPTSDIIGRWETVERSPEGLRRMLQFNSDGSFTRTAGATFKGTYRLQDNQLTIDSQSDSGMETDTQQISITADTLIIKFEGTQMEGIRSSPRVPDSPAIVGRWQFDVPAYHGGGKAGFMEFEFSKNGGFISRIELFPQKGHYKIKGDLLVTTVDKETEISKFRFEDGFLLLKPPPDIGTEEKYRRIEKR